MEGTFLDSHSHHDSTMVLLASIPTLSLANLWSMRYQLAYFYLL